MVWYVETTTAEFYAAFRIEDEANIGFWDALIVAAAIKARVNRILSDDLSAGKRSSVITSNPASHGHFKTGQAANSGQLGCT